MYLKALELHGFKSFPEKTRLTFEKPVTAIVGPNGSGKSNISDALMWVMGEQSSKALRGGKMEDVIFGGTEKRSQVGYAEVTLVLDNRDAALAIEADEVEVTRRYYRSGESEYAINRKTVRLRDVNELFMDTGLGRDGYSNIGQGKVDSILSAKSTDRREIFEEAAGISRFRHRKEESERKLQRAEDDLMRVGDKIAELEMQVEPLRKQSETAKKYLLFRDELRGLEITLWLHDLEELAEKHKKIQADALASSGMLEKARRELDALYAASEEYTNEMRARELEAESQREKLRAKEAELAELEARLAVLKADLANNKRNIQRLDEELTRQADQHSGIASQVEERRQRVAGICAEREAVKAALAALEAQEKSLAASESASQQQIFDLTRAERQAADEAAALRTELSAAATAMQEVEDREKNLLAELVSEQNRLTETRQAAEAHAKLLQEAKEEAEAKRNVVKGFTIRTDSRRKQVEETAEKLTHSRMDHNAAASRLQMLTDMERDYEGYSRAVKTVMRERQRGTLRGVHGPAGELVKTEDRYALAIETALGAAMQHIIVATEGDGKAVINLLKRLDAGRLTLLPMNVIRGARMNEPGLEEEDGFEGIASDLVTYDGQYSQIFLNLLGRTAVAETMDAAIAIARRHHHKFRIVTLDGQVINAGGSMTGGSSNKNTGILSRANEVKLLTKRVEELKAKLNGLTEAAENARRELASAEYQLRIAQDELREAESLVDKRTGEESQFTLVSAAIETHLTQLREERASSRRRSEELKARVAALRSAIQSREAENAALQQRLEEATGGREALSEQHRALLDAEAEKKAQLASLQAEEETQQAAIAELDALRSGLSDNREKQLETLSTMRSLEEDIVKSITRSEGELSRRHKEAESLEGDIGRLQNARFTLEAARTRNDKEAKDKNARLIELERENSRIEQRRVAAEMEEKQIADKLWDSYELTRSTAELQRLPLENLREARRRTGELRREMSKLGTPNLGAIEEFERVNARYAYLTDQRDDIDKSRKELLRIIGDITKEMTAIFSVEFVRINQSFKETFLELFGGGKANLELEDEENILDCGIEIKVQPPGKTLKTITLLSGGEKAFVAIALYFAILKIRPTPFVVMDEIEAALDDANVVRTAHYMRRLSDKTQFIVITHRRGTMEEADILFGVTMQERGVSKVLKIDLDEAEKTLDEAK